MMARKSSLRIRFVFSAQGGRATERAARQRFVNEFAGTIVDELIFRTAENDYREISGRLEKQFAADAKRELVHMVALFKQHIIGATSNAPAGVLNTVAEPGQYGFKVPIKASISPWADRKPNYLRDKRKRLGHNRWFEDSGILRQITDAGEWVGAFGPIHAAFKRNRALTDAANTPGARLGKVFNTGDPRHVKVAIGTVQVFALTNITPQMLPALASGDPETMNPSRPNAGLINLIQNMPGGGDEIAYRLGGTNKGPGNHIYRPTLEPFLAYFLTNAIPAAVASRLRENNFSRSSAGRTR